MRFPFVSTLIGAAIDVFSEIDSDTSTEARYLSLPIKLILVPGYVLGGIIALFADLCVNAFDVVISIPSIISKIRSGSDSENDFDEDHIPHESIPLDPPDISENNSIPSRVWSSLQSCPNPMTMFYNRYIKTTERLSNVHGIHQNSSVYNALEEEGSVHSANSSSRFNIF